MLSQAFSLQRHSWFCTLKACDNIAQGETLGSEADTTIDRLKEELKKANIDFASMDRNEPARVEDPFGQRRGSRALS